MAKKTGLPIWFAVSTGLILFFGNILAYRTPLQDILTIAARDPERGYIFIVPVVAAYLAWLRRTRIREFTVRPSWVGPLIMLLGWLCYLIGGSESVMFMWHMGFLISIIGGIVTFTGPGVLRPFAPAFLVLFVMVPLPGSARQLMTQPMQALATSVSAFILDLSGVPAVQAGNLITINGVTVAVGEACDGMRLLVPLGLVIFAFVFSLPLNWKMRSALIIASVPVGLVCNVFRLIPTALAYGYTPAIAENVHDLGGWGMIPLSIVILLGLLRLIEWLDIPVSRWRLVTG
jgi:exosortase